MPEKENKIKVSAPRENPHICYLPADRKEKIEVIKKVMGMSLYRLLCEYSHRTLNTKEDIINYKKELKQQGYRNIGDWATELIDRLYIDICKKERL